MKSTTFQLVLLGVFALAAVLAILAFSGLLPIFRSSAEKATGPVTVWGTIPKGIIGALLENVERDNRGLSITYVEKDPKTFDREFIEALAAGRGPDLFLLPQDLILRYEDKIMMIPFSSLSERSFKDTYVQEGELYLTPQGILGLPLTIDPLVLYWNRNLFGAANLTAPPAHWEEALSMVPALTVKSDAGTLTQSAVALGETTNVDHAIDILDLLMLQTGSPMIARDETGKPFVTVYEGSTKAAEDSLRFFSQFSDPAKSVYSWSKALPSAKERFLSERLALYLGYASELRDIRSKNPHLDFDVAPVPIPGTSKATITVGRMQALAVPRAAKNVQGAFFLAGTMSGRAFSEELAKALLLPPARRDLLAARPTDAYQEVFYKSALNARGALEVDPATTADIFTRMVADVTSGKRTPFDAVTQAASLLEHALNPR